MSNIPNNQEPEFRINLGLFIGSMVFASLASLAVSLMASQLDNVDCSNPEKFSDVVKQQYGTGQKAIDYCHSRIEETRSMGSWISIGLLFVPIITGIGYWRTNRKTKSEKSSL